MACFEYGYANITSRSISEIPNAILSRTASVDIPHPGK